MVTRELVVPMLVHVTLIAPATARAVQLPATTGYVTGLRLEDANELRKPVEVQSRQDALPAMLLREYTAPTQHELVITVVALMELAHAPTPLRAVTVSRKALGSALPTLLHCTVANMPPGPARRHRCRRECTGKPLLTTGTQSRVQEGIREF